MLPMLTQKPKKDTRMPRTCGGVASTVYTFEKVIKNPFDRPRMILPAYRPLRDVVPTFKKELMSYWGLVLMFQPECTFGSLCPKTFKNPTIAWNPATAIVSNPYCALAIETTQQIMRTRQFASIDVLRSVLIILVISENESGVIREGLRLVTVP